VTREAALDTAIAALCVGPCRDCARGLIDREQLEAGQVPLAQDPVRFAKAFRQSWLHSSTTVGNIRTDSALGHLDRPDHKPYQIVTSLHYCSAHKPFPLAPFAAYQNIAPDDMAALIADLCSLPAIE
jgi:hypothetical protein